MANSFLDKTGLAYLWGKIVALVNRKQDALTFDSTPTDNSTNPVTSGGVKAYVDANAGGSGDSPVESGSGVGSAQTKAYTVGSSTRAQTASGQGAFAEGSETIAWGSSGHAEGYATKSGSDSHAEGFESASTMCSHAEGSTVASIYSHAEGRNVAALATYTGGSLEGGAHAEGLGQYYDSTVQTIYSNGRCILESLSSNIGTANHVALDTDTGNIYRVSNVAISSRQVYLTGNSEDDHVNSVKKGHVLRFYPYCAVGDGAHVEGINCKALEKGAHAEGSYTQASGQYSHAEGYYTTAQGTNQHVEGKFNVIDTSNKYAHITGIGTSATARKNGFTVDWSGNGVFAGGVRAGANPSYDNDLTTKQYVDSKVYMAIDERNAPVTLRTRYDEDYGANVLYGYLPSIYEETNIVANEIFLTDAYRYVYEYIDASNNTITIPLTKCISYAFDSGSQYIQKLIFGDNEAVFVDLPSGVMVPEAEWHRDGE